MFDKFIHFIKYNNFTVLIFVFLFILGTGVFASETGREIIGKKQEKIQGIDNSLLLEVDLDQFDMEFKIETIEEDEEKYYVTYTFLDLVTIDNAWQYQLREKSREISKKIKENLGVYLIEELKEEQEARIKDLKEEQGKAKNDGPQKRFFVKEYSGLIGEVLDITSKVFTEYEAVKKEELESPVPLEDLNKLKKGNERKAVSNGSDDLTEIYKDYISEKDPDRDNVFGFLDNCPEIYNPDQLDGDNDGIGDECDLTPFLEENKGENNNNKNSKEDEDNNEEDNNEDSDSQGSSDENNDDSVKNNEDDNENSEENENNNNSEEEYNNVEIIDLENNFNSESDGKDENNNDNNEETEDSENNQENTTNDTTESNDTDSDNDNTTE